VSNRELEHLRRIDDAERVLAQYHRIRNLIVATAAGSAVGVVASSQLLSTGGWAIGAVIVSGVLLLVAFGVFPWWIWWNHSEPPGAYGISRKSAPGPAARLRAVRRQYEDFVAEQVQS